MKKIILLFLFCHSFIFSQIKEEISSINKNNTKTNNSSEELSRAPTNPTKFIFNVKFHIVKNTNGTGPTQNYGINEVMNAMKILNTTFNPHNIFFKYKGFDIIQNTTYMRIRSVVGGEIEEFLQPQDISHPLYSSLIAYSKTAAVAVYDYNAMNLFIVEGIDINNGASQISGYTSGAGVDSAYTYNSFLSPILPREIAKNFSLLKIYKNYNQPNCEYVNGSNAATAGDLVIDTPASPRFNINDVNPTSCLFVNANNRTDCNGVLYGSNVLVTNFMNSSNSCRYLSPNYSPATANFTSGQIAKMRTFIGLNYNNTANLYGYYSAKAALADLYKPYRVTNVSGVRTHYFQKGFDYTFSNTNPVTVANTDVMPIINNVVADYCLTIAQVNFGNQIPANGGCFVVSNTLAPYGRLTQAVTEEVAVEEVKDSNEFISGTISSLKSLLIGAYKTQTLDKNQINDINLEENLPKDEYHVITKMTSSGKTVQKVIYIKN